MKAKDLMIGDWVSCYNPSKAIDDYAVIKGICPLEGSAQPHTFNVKFRDNLFFVNARNFCVKPIPLTAEILEKNIPFERYWDSTKNNPKGSVTEWRKDTDEATIFVRDFRDQKGEYILEIHIRDSANYGVKKNIYNVHELQHALRLCGLDDLADNLII